MNEGQRENRCLGWFREGGWDVLHGPDIDPDSNTPMRAGYAQVTLDSHLREVFEELRNTLLPKLLSGEITPTGREATL